MNSGGRKEANKAGGCKNLSELIGMKQKHPTFHWSSGLKRKQTAQQADMWLEEQSLIERSKVSSSKTRSKEKPRQTYSSSNNKHVSYIQM